MRGDVDVEKPIQFLPFQAIPLLLVTYGVKLSPCLISAGVTSGAWSEHQFQFLRPAGSAALDMILHPSPADVVDVADAKNDYEISLAVPTKF